eukprot:CAMPEP_0197863036 /NCGR_PEP_ID=MMETSP1438-20131217/40199_1 /TAXON_ID=1461541 /ORGANISM="Pterosperma sp., Strain CCMP1384" /LENGTH=300 /DNA_ID=CAMNT_0043480777 /DNA_START=1 /DNA_END=903 /DNA_ORIENTATION=+
MINFDLQALRYLCTHRTLGKDLITMWYSRSGSTRDEVELLLMKLMNEEDGSKTISDGLEEQQVVKFVTDLRAKRQMQVAKATGGANLLNPEKYNPSGMPLEADRVVEDKEREADLAKIDTAKLSQYMVTLIPRNTRDPVVVDTMAGTGRVCIELANRLQHLSVHVYGNETSPQVVDYLNRRAHLPETPASSNTEVASKDSDSRTCSNFTAVMSPDGTLEGLPVGADVALMLSVWTYASEPVDLLNAACAKLKKGGKLMLIEDDVNLLAHAKKAALQGGLVLYSEPDLLKDHFISVFTTAA